MKLVRILFVGMSLFALLTACGEGFKATVVDSTADGTTKTPAEIKQEAEQNAQRPEAPRTVYESILDDIGADMANMDPEQVRQFGLSIRAAGLQLNSQGMGNNEIAEMEVDFRTSCQSNGEKSVRITNMRYRDFSSGQVSRSGLTYDGYEIYGRCVQASCEEIVVKFTLPSQNIAVLIPFKRTQINEHAPSGTVHRTYEPAYDYHTFRDLKPYYQSATTIDRFDNGICVAEQSWGGPNGEFGGLNETNTNHNQPTQGTTNNNGGGAVDPTLGSPFIPAPAPQSFEEFLFMNPGGTL